MKRAEHERLVANKHVTKDVAARKGDREASTVESGAAPDAIRRSTIDVSGEGEVSAVVRGERYTLERDKPAIVTSENMTQSSKPESKMNVEEDSEFQSQENLTKVVEMEAMEISADTNGADKVGETPLVDLPIIGGKSVATIADATVEGSCREERDKQSVPYVVNVDDASSDITSRQDPESSAGLLPDEQVPIVLKTSENSGIDAGGDKGEKEVLEHTSAKKTADYKRFELAKREIAALAAQAEEGLEFINQSVDMADILRGFTINMHGVPVHDIPTERGHLLKGRSALRDR